MNSAKSSGPGLPKELMQVIAARGENYHATVTGVAANGDPIARTVDPPRHGSVPFSANPAFDRLLVKRLNQRAEKMIYSKDGKVVREDHIVVARNGKSMVQTRTGMDPEGKPIPGTQPTFRDKL